jgi:3,4-dihydroxy 2-butanone 4-phosphate synthase
MKDVPQTGSARSRVEAALEALRSGKGVLVTDDEDRENEADLIFGAETLSCEQMAMLIRECSGIVCLCLSDEQIQRLALPMMVVDNTSAHGTAFTVSIDAARGAGTGVSAADRVRTVEVAIAVDSHPADLARPGHVFPLRAHPAGVLGRRGHTEATVDLVRLAGWRPAGVLCELMNPDGSMARGKEVAAFAVRHSLPVVSVDDVVAYCHWAEARLTFPRGSGDARPAVDGPLSSRPSPVGNPASVHACVPPPRS